MPFHIIRNDITKVKADAIVNTANPEPIFSRGTDRALYRAAGAEKLLAARKEIGSIPVGEAALTPAFGLAARYIIHTVGPAWQGGSHGEADALRRCYQNSLCLAKERGCESIAFPLLSAGSYGFPREEALQIALSEIRAFLEKEDMMVWLVVFDRESLAVSETLFPDMDAYIDSHYVEARMAEEYGAPYAAAAFPPEGEDTGVSAAFPSGGMAAEASTAFPSEEKAAGASAAFPSEGKDTRTSAAFPAGGKDPGASTAFPAGGTAVRASAGFVPPPAAEKQSEGRGGIFRKKRKAKTGHRGKQDAAAFSGNAPTPEPCAAVAFLERSLPERSLEDVMAQLGETFQQRLFRLIDERSLTDVEVYKRANLDRKLFSKIRCNADYRPKKLTAVALAVALELNLDETKDLLSRAEMALSPSSKFDLIITYFIEHEVYDIYIINAALFQHGQQLLGA